MSGTLSWLSSSSSSSFIRWSSASSSSSPTFTKSLSWWLMGDVSISSIWSFSTMDSLSSSSSLITRLSSISPLAIALLTFSTTLFSSIFLSSPLPFFSFAFLIAGRPTLFSLFFSSLSGCFLWVLAAAAFLVSITFLLLSSFFSLLGGGVELLWTSGFDGIAFLAFTAAASFDSALTSGFLVFGRAASFGFDLIATNFFFDLSLSLTSSEGISFLTACFCFSSLSFLLLSSLSLLAIASFSSFSFLAAASFSSFSFLAIISFSSFSFLAWASFSSFSFLSFSFLSLSAFFFLSSFSNRSFFSFSNFSFSSFSLSLFSLSSFLSRSCFSFSSLSFFSFASFLLASFSFLSRSVLSGWPGLLSVFWALLLSLLCRPDFASFRELGEQVACFRHSSFRSFSRPLKILFCGVLPGKRSLVIVSFGFAGCQISRAQMETRFAMGNHNSFPSTFIPAFMLPSCPMSSDQRERNSFTSRDSLDGLRTYMSSFPCPTLW